MRCNLYLNELLCLFVFSCYHICGKKNFLWALFLFCSKNFFLLEVQFLGEGRHQNIGSESQQHNLCTKHTFYPSSLFISSCISARQLICNCVWGAVSKREREGDIKIFFLPYFFSKLICICLWGAVSRREGDIKILGGTRHAHPAKNHLGEIFKGKKMAPIYPQMLSKYLAEKNAKT